MGLLLFCASGAWVIDLKLRRVSGTLDLTTGLTGVLAAGERSTREVGNLKAGYYIRDGIFIVPKNATVKDGTVV
jgi:hypothetical protein